MVTDDVPIVATRAVDKNRTLMIAMFRDPMRRPSLTRLAGEGNFICWFILAALFEFGFLFLRQGW